MKKQVRRINLAYRGLREIPPEVAPRLRGIEQLDLTSNELSDLLSLRSIALSESLTDLILDHNEFTHNFKVPRMDSLESLSVNHNRISNLSVFMNYLVQKAPNLSFLSLLCNEACPNFFNGGTLNQYKDYRYYVISRMPKLVFLDCEKVTVEERREAERIYASLALSENKRIEAVKQEDQAAAEGIHRAEDELTPERKRRGSKVTSPERRDSVSASSTAPPPPPPPLPPASPGAPTPRAPPSSTPKPVSSGDRVDVPRGEDDEDSIKLDAPGNEKQDDTPESEEGAAEPTGKPKWMSDAVALPVFGEIASQLKAQPLVPSKLRTAAKDKPQQLAEGVLPSVPESDDLVVPPELPPVPVDDSSDSFPSEEEVEDWDDDEDPKNLTPLPPPILDDMSYAEHLQPQGGKGGGLSGADRSRMVGRGRGSKVFRRVPNGRGASAATTVQKPEWLSATRTSRARAREEAVAGRTIRSSQSRATDTGQRLPSLAQPLRAPPVPPPIPESSGFSISAPSRSAPVPSEAKIHTTASSDVVDLLAPRRQAPVPAAKMPMAAPQRTAPVPADLFRQS